MFEISYFALIVGEAKVAPRVPQRVRWFRRVSWWDRLV